MNARNPSPPRPHLLLRASAGSGKTYQLTRRLIGLLADGEEAKSVLAVTFSRKAAGEFRRKLLATLAEACLLPQSAKALAKEIGQPEWNQADFLGLLHHCVRFPDEPRLSTIDAFFYEVISLFRMELGLGAEIQLLDENREGSTKRDLLRSIVNASDPAIRETIAEQVRQSFWDESRRSFQDTFETWLQNAVSLYRRAPDAALWGRLPPDTSLPKCDADVWRAAVDRLDQAMPRGSLKPAAAEAVDEVIAQLLEWDFGPELPKPAVNWITAWPEHEDNLLAGKKSFRPNKTSVTLGPEAGASLIQVSQCFFAQCLRLKQKTTAGIFVFAELYDKEYRRQILANGLLQFQDLPYLLSGLGDLDRAEMAYRLDARVRHWLLDEFQDTSRSQWRVISPLIEELFYDAEENRSFFCVGDRKQAIYAWRDGDSRLFEELWQTYKDFEPRPLESRDLARTYRCAPRIVAFVNRLLGEREHFPKGLSPGAVEDWNRNWSTHTPAFKEPEGFVQVTCCADEEAQNRAMLHYFHEKQPWRSSGTVAVLCRKNDEANRLEALLRNEGIPTVRDGALSLAKDFATGRLYHSILRVLTHPGDRLALEHLRMSSANDALQRFCGENEVTSASLRKAWETRSPTAFTRDLAKELDHDGFLDDAGRRCLRALNHIVHKRSTSATGYLDGLLQDVEGARIEASASENCVQLMTIHRSKGLEFDTVLLPDIDKLGGGGDISGDLWVDEDENSEIRAILEGAKTDVVAGFPGLRAWREEQIRKKDFETICLLYVAVTRAKEELRVFFPKPKRKSSGSVVTWLENAFAENKPSAESYPESEDWIKEGSERTDSSESRSDQPTEAHPEKSIPQEPPRWPKEQTALEPVRLNPSTHANSATAGLFRRSRSAGLSLGARVHELLSLREWPGRDWPDLAGANEASADLLTRALRAPAIRELLEPPAFPMEVWREKAFDVCTEGQWISGVFDRVHLPVDWKTEAKSRIQIIDFKSDVTTGSGKELDQLTHRYTEQLKNYRRCLGLILGAPEEQIDCLLVFLHAGEVREA